jgi:hypothetical protein
MPRVRAIAFPPESQLHACAADAYFEDAYEAPLADTKQAPLEIARRLLSATPPWVEFLLAIRNRAVKPLGIKNVGRLGAVESRPSSTLAVGDKVSFFDILSLDATEAVLGIDDVHLDVRISFLKRLGTEPTYVVATLVKTHNGLGRIYMLPVAPMHRLIVRTAMASVAT